MIGNYIIAHCISVLIFIALNQIPFMRMRIDEMEKFQICLLSVFLITPLVFIIVPVCFYGVIEEFEVWEFLVKERSFKKDKKVK